MNSEYISRTKFSEKKYSTTWKIENYNEEDITYQSNENDFDGYKVFFSLKIESNSKPIFYIHLPNLPNNTTINYKFSIVSPSYGGLSLKKQNKIDEESRIIELQIGIDQKDFLNSYLFENNYLKCNFFCNFHWNDEDNNNIKEIKKSFNNDDIISKLNLTINQDKKLQQLNEKIEKIKNELLNLEQKNLLLNNENEYEKKIKKIENENNNKIKKYEDEIFNFKTKNNLFENIKLNEKELIYSKLYFLMNDSFNFLDDPLLIASRIILYDMGLMIYGGFVRDYIIRNQVANDLDVLVPKNKDVNIVSQDLIKLLTERGFQQFNPPKKYNSLKHFFQYKNKQFEIDLVEESKKSTFSDYPHVECDVSNLLISKNIKNYLQKKFPNAGSNIITLDLSIENCLRHEFIYFNISKQKDRIQKKYFHRGWTCINPLSLEYQQYGNNNPNLYKPNNKFDYDWSKK